MVNAPVVPEAGPDQTFAAGHYVILNGIIYPSGNLPFQWETSGYGSFSNPSSLFTNYNPGHLDSLGIGVFLSLHVMDDVCGEQVDSMNAYFNADPFATFSQ
jgi:hypothetical protein